MPGHDVVGVATVLASSWLNGAAGILVQYGVVKDELAPGGRDERRLGFVPDQARGEFVAFEVAVDAVVLEAVDRVGKVGAGEVKVAVDEKLAIRDGGHFHVGFDV